MWEMIHHFLNNIWQRQLFSTCSHQIVAWASGVTKKKKKGSQRNSFGYMHTNRHRMWRLSSFSVSSQSPCKTAILLTGSENVAMAFQVQRDQTWSTSTETFAHFALCEGQPVVFIVAIWLRLTCLSHSDSGKRGWQQMLPCQSRVMEVHGIYPALQMQWLLKMTGSQEITQDS